MSNHPANLAVRFALELAALLGWGLWGRSALAGWAGWALACGLPLAAALVWGTLRVPNDPGPAPVPVPGWVRLVVEAVVLGGAAWAFYASGRPVWALIYGMVLVAHYAASYDRVGWLLGRGPRPG
jgi:hypothetical protein